MKMTNFVADLAAPVLIFALNPPSHAASIAEWVSPGDGLVARSFLQEGLQGGPYVGEEFGLAVFVGMHPVRLHEVGRERDVRQ